MKANKCIKCDNQTYQKDGICVICRIGISGMSTELFDLIKKDRRNVRRAHKLLKG